MPSSEPKPSFNLIDTPWIKVLTTESLAEEVSVRELFRNAHLYQCFNGEMPTQNFALLRFLLVFLYRSLQETLTDDPVEDWEALWEAEELPVETIEAYLDAWKENFDLFDADKPFLQVSDLTISKDEWHSLERIVPDSNDQGSLFSRRDPNLPITAAEAARWLLTCHAYDSAGIKTHAVGDPRGKNGKIYAGDGRGIGWCGWLGGITIVGKTIKETLLLNFLPEYATADDAPYWETSKLSVGERAGSEVIPTGPVSLLVWPSRRVRLQQTDDGNVSAVRLTYGDPLDHRSQYGTELMTRWRYSAPQSKAAKADIYMPEQLDGSRALWRGITSLLPDGNIEMVKGQSGKVAAKIPSTSTQWIQRMVNEGILPEDYFLTLSVVSVVYGPQQSVVDFTVHDELTFRSTLTSKTQTDLRAHIRIAVLRAEAAGVAYGNFRGNLAKSSGSGLEGDRDRAFKEYYSQIDPLFRAWISSLDSNSNPEQSLQEWTETTRNLVHNLGANALKGVSDAAWIGREIKDQFFDAGLSEKWFRQAVAKCLPSPQQSPSITSEE